MGWEMGEAFHWLFEKKALFYEKSWLLVELFIFFWLIAGDSFYSQFPYLEG